MNGNNILADTSVLIHFLNGNEKINNFISDKNIFISVISEIEILSLPGMTIEQEKLVRDFLEELVGIEMQKEIRLKAVEIRRKYKIKLPDAVIAATSILYSLPLFTSDKGFEKIKELESVIF
jgi:predicted nucleic acid-binding protein